LDFRLAMGAVLPNRFGTAWIAGTAASQNSSVQNRADIPESIEKAVAFHESRRSSPVRG
jgi:hypothetical protein